MIRHHPPIHKPILRHEIIIAHAEHEILVPVLGAPVPRIHRHETHALPLLVQEPLVLRTAVVHPEAVELRVDVEVEEGAVLRGGDAGVQDTGSAGDGARGCVGGGGADVRGGGEVEDVEVAVEGLGGLLAVASAGVAREDEELRGGEVVDFGVAGDLWGARGVCVEGEGDDVFVGENGGAGGDVVGEEAGLAAVGLLGAAFLVEGGLQEGVEGGAVVGDSEAFEALVVVAAGLGVGGEHFAGGVVAGRGVGGEADGGVAAGDVGLGGADGELHFAVAAEFVDVGAVLVADPEGAVAVEDEAFAVDGDGFASWAGAAEAISHVGGYG